MKVKLINDEVLDIVSGGRLVDGWQDIVLKLISLYKSKFNDEGKQKLKDVMVLGLTDPTSLIDERDIIALNDFINTNWDK